MTLNQARQDLADKVAAEGLRVTLDPRNVNPPCVLVGLPSPITRRAPCSFQAVVAVSAVAPPPGNDDASRWLLDTTETLLTALGLAEATSTVVTVGDVDLPGYELLVTLLTD